MLRRRSGARGGLAIALCLGLVASGCGFMQPEQVPTPIPTAVTVQKPTYIVQRGDVVVKLASEAEVVPTETTPLSFKEDGRLQTIGVQRGDTVKKEQVLAKLDTADVDKSLQDAQAALDAAEVKLAASQRITRFALEKANIQLDIKNTTLAKLRANNASSFDIQAAEGEVKLAQVSVDELKSAVDEQAQREVLRAREAVARLQETLNARTLKAPMDGVVTAVGERLTPTTAVRAQQMIVTVASPERTELSATLSQDLSAITVGHPVTFTVSRLPNQAFSGSLAKLPGVQRSPAVDDKRFTFIGYDNSVLKLNIGERARVEIVLEDNRNVLWLPAGAIRTFMGRSFVVLRDGDVDKRVDVTLGSKADDKVVVRRGLEEGQVVIGP